MVETYTVTYKMPNGPVCTSNGHTRLGAAALMDSVLQHGGVGNCVPDNAPKHRRPDAVGAG